MTAMLGYGGSLVSKLRTPSRNMCIWVYTHFLLGTSSHVRYTHFFWVPSSHSGTHTFLFRYPVFIRARTPFNLGTQFHLGTHTFYYGTQFSFGYAHFFWGTQFSFGYAPCFVWVPRSRLGTLTFLYLFSFGYDPRRTCAGSCVCLSVRVLSHFTSNQSLHRRYHIFSVG